MVIKSNYWIQDTNNVPTEGMELEQKEGEKREVKRSSDKILSCRPISSSHWYAVSHLYILCKVVAQEAASHWLSLSTQGGPGYRTMARKGGEAKQSLISQQAHEKKLCPFCLLILKAIRISDIQEWDPLLTSKLSTVEEPSNNNHYHKASIFFSSFSIILTFLSTGRTNCSNETTSTTYCPTRHSRLEVEESELNFKDKHKSF